MAFDWTTQKFAWPRRVKGVVITGNLRRWNPITRKNYLMDCWDGDLEWYMFRRPRGTDKVLPDDFEEFLDKPDEIDASKLTFRAWAPQRPLPSKTEMVLSTGSDSGTVLTSYLHRTQSFKLFFNNYSTNLP